MLIRSATFDVLRCVAFAAIVAGTTVMIRRLVRAVPIRRAAVPEARIGERRVASFIARIAPVAVILVALAALLTSTKLAHHALIVTDRAGVLHVEHEISLGQVAPTRDIDGDVWVINRSSRALQCVHMPFGDWAYSREAFVIAAGEAATLPRIPQNIGPDDVPREWESSSLWLTWER
jgi:hypothetical protein